MTIKYLAVPIGTATSVEWRGVVSRHGESGYKIFWCASALAEMAAKAAAGGAIVYPTGEPKTPTDLCGELGIEAAWAEVHLFPTLCRLGEGCVDQETGAWVCTSPMLSRTLDWQNSVVKALPEPLQPQKPGRKSIFSRTLTEAEYKAWQRNCVLPAGVFLQKECPKRSKGKCPEMSGNCPCLSENCPEMSGNCPEIEGDDFRTDGVEDVENVEEKKCPEIPNIKVKGNKKTAAAKTGQPAAISPAAQDQNPTPPPDDVMAAIDLLPLAARLDCLGVAMDHQHLPLEVITSNTQLLVDRLASQASKPIPNPGGWLKKALTRDYAVSRRQTEAEATAAKNRAAAKKQEEAEREERERRAELQRQAQLLSLFSQMPAAERDQIQEDAAEYCRRFGGESQPVIKARVLDVLSERYLPLSL